MPSTAGTVRAAAADDDAIALQLASCYGFAGAPEAAAALERFGDPAALPDATRGRIELARSALLLRAGRRDEPPSPPSPAKMC